MWPVKELTYFKSFLINLNVIHKWSGPAHSAQTVCLLTPLQSPFHLSLPLVLSSGWTCLSTSVAMPLSDGEFVLRSELERKDSGLLTPSLMPSPGSLVGGGGLRAS